LVYKINYKDKEFYPDKEIILRIIEMNSILSKKELGKIRTENDLVDKDKVFYFLESKKKGEYGVYQDNPEKRYSFKFQDKDLGFFLIHICTKKFKEMSNP
jgi:hypothetical protein